MGHRCTATTRDGDGRPVCLDCANERPCVALRTEGATRDESSVCAALDVYGQLTFSGDAGEVIQRTPEELGIARTVAHEEPIQDIRPEWGSSYRGPMSRARVTRDQVKPTAAPVVRAAVPEAQRPEPQMLEKEMGMRTIKVGVKCAADGCDGPAFDGKRYCSKKHGWKNVEDRKRAAKDATTPRTDAEKPAKRGNVATPTVATTNAVPIQTTRMPQMPLPGGEYALITELARVDRSNKAVPVEFTPTDVQRLIEKFNDAQRTAFVAAGLHAALLA
jgi:hypothetical protein